MTALDRQTERWLDLFAGEPAISVTLGPPRFRIPVDAAAALGLPACASCGCAIDETTHGLVHWHGDVFHANCVHDELLSLGVAS